MRQCIFVVADRAQLQELLPLLKYAKESGLRHSVWITGEQQEQLESIRSETGLATSLVLPNRPAPSSGLLRALYWIPLTMYRCYYYVHSVKMWTTKGPLVILHDDRLSTWLASHAGRWGGGQLLHLQHTPNSRPARHAILRKVRFAFCPQGASDERASRYPGCTVVGVESDDVRLVGDTLLRWTGGKSRDA